MKKDIKLAAKISGGFGLLLIIVIALGVFVTLKCASLRKVSSGISDFSVP